MGAPDVEHCLKMADEADRLAAIVSYGRDKVRLKAQAEDWRTQAKIGEASSAAEAQSGLKEKRSFAGPRWLDGRPVNDFLSTAYRRLRNIGSR